MQPVEHERPGPLVTTIRIVLIVIEAWLVIMTIILALAFFLGLLGASSNSDFASWIYNRANELMTPFHGMFDDVELTGGIEINMSLVFATIIYGIAAGLLGGILNRFRNS